MLNYLFHILLFPIALVGCSGNDLAIIIVKDFFGFDRSQVIDALAQLTVMVEEVGFAFELDNRVVCRPPQHRLQNSTSIGEGSERAVTDGEAEENRLARLGGKDLDFLNFACELVHIITKLSNSRSLGGDTLAADFLRTLPLRIKDIIALLVALQLSTPETSEVEISLSIVIHKACGVNAVATLDRLWVWGERTLWLVTDSNTNAEDSLLVSCGEVKEVFAVFLSGIRSPELLGHPRDVFCLQDDTMVSDLGRRVQALSTEDMVVSHVVLIAIVVELDIGLTIVRGIDIDLAIEDMG
ncbi:hypothetical protein HG531_013041 [Fusarium graminearum]|nr:hypothetical protein HG531_013041 [Fusarium graminearum]